MVKLKLSSTKQNGEVKSRTFEYNGEEYDLTDEPILWYGLWAAALSILSILVSATLSVMARIFVYLKTTGAIDGLVSLTIQVFQIIMLLFTVFVILGIIKYYVTGSPEPFVTVEIDKSSEVESEE